MRPKATASTHNLAGPLAPSIATVSPRIVGTSPMLAEPLLTDDDAADLLSLSVATLKKWRRIQRGPRYYRLGSAIRYRREDLESFISGSAANPSSGRHDENSDR